MTKYILINNNIVSYVLDIQSEDSDFIDQTVQSFPHEELVIKEDSFPVIQGQEKYNDYFREVQPFSSWTWNEELKKWEAPTAYPENGQYNWDENTSSWIDME